MTEPVTSPPPLAAQRLRHDGHRHAGWHAHAQGQLYALDDGLLVVETEGATWAMPPGRIGWLPPHCAHAAQGHGALAGWSVYLDAELCASLPATPCVLAGSALVAAIVARMVDWPPAAPLDPPRRRLLEVLIDELAQGLAEPLALPLPRDRRLLAITQALLADLADRRTLAQWAGWAGLSERTLSRRFAAETGLGFAQWRQQARLVKSFEWLARGEPVGNVALSLGYDSVSAFIAAFRRSFGCTPASCFRPGRPRPAIDAM